MQMRKHQAVTPLLYADWPRRQKAAHRQFHRRHPRENDALEQSLLPHDFAGILSRCRRNITYRSAMATA